MSTVKMEQPWGKLDRGTGRTHHLAHHCADVAASFLGLVRLPVIRQRLEATVERRLDEREIERLGVLVFLHDIGKLFPSFQAKGWPKGVWKKEPSGHVREGLDLFSTERTWKAAVCLHAEDLRAWFGDAASSLLRAVLAHHGRPLPPGDGGSDTANTVRENWRRVGNYDPDAAAEAIGALLPKWFPAAFEEGGEPLSCTARLEHLLAGLTALVDWIGSDADRFAYVANLDADYMTKARDRAERALAGFGLDAKQQRAVLPAPPDFSAFTRFSSPNPQQALVNEAPLDARLLILEAETGSGKTEAALWRYFRLFEAGLVDGLYFAVPTRAAAVQLHARVCDAARRLFGDADPQPILAVPGYIRAGDVQGTPLPDWKVRWDDEGESAEDRLAARWAAEHSKRYLAAQMAVGTVDQAMLATLMVKHAHLRLASLSRSLLVIDEVHASDRYMTTIQKALLDAHLAVGGHAMLMSATLGSVARSAWLGQPQPGLDAAIAAPYPALWRCGEEAARSSEAESKAGKAVHMETLPSMAPDATAECALRAARAGARVLVIRNTVDRAIETLQAVETLAEDEDEDLLFRVSEVVTLHHGRFAPQDRKILDGAVEQALTTEKTRQPQGRIVIGTQTLEQSLDIDADFLITDLCPVDVLLQRIGRLHRHHLARPEGFEAARCVVMTPENGLEPLLAPAFDNGLGAWKEAGTYQGIYRDLSILELTRRLVTKHEIWRIPEMNRSLVERATHPEAIAALHDELGDKWCAYDHKILASDLAQDGIARLSLVNFGQSLAELRFADRDEHIRTRLGAEGARIAFAEPLPTGPFGETVSETVLPAHWSHGLATADEPVAAQPVEGGFSFSASGFSFRYDRLGLHRIEENRSEQSS